MVEGINELAVLVTALLAVAVGSVWYSPLVFGKQWMQAADLTDADMEKSSRHIGRLLIAAVCTGIVLFFVVAKFVSYAQELTVSFLEMGALLLILFGTIVTSVVIGEHKPRAYLYVHMSYAATVLLGGMSVLWYWPW